MSFGRMGSLGRGFGRLGSPSGAVNPLFSMTFDQATAAYSTVKDYSFGTDPPPGGATQINDATALAVDFQDYRNNEPKPATRNNEWQVYTLFSSTANWVFAADALEITANLPNGAPVGYGSTTISGAVSDSETVNVADATNFSVGQIVSLGANQDANMHVTRSFGIRNVTVAGDTLTTTFNLSLLGLSNVVFSQTVDGTSANSVYAQAFVDAINADATLQSLGVKAYKPVTPGAYRITWPRRSGVVGAPPFGPLANGSFQWISVSPTKTGTALHEDKATVLITWVVAKSGNTLTLNHKITAGNGDSLYYNPAKILERTNTYSSPGTSFNIPNNTGVGNDMAISFGFNDNNFRQVTSSTATSVTFDATVGVTDGLLPCLHPVWIPKTSAATTASTVLSFTTIGTGVRAGQRYAPFQADPDSNIRVVSVNRAGSPHTVTLDTAVTVASNTRVAFYEPIESGEMWTKDGYCPGADGRNWIALEWTCDFPLADDIAAWPANWIFEDLTNLTGLPTPANSGQEIDVTDPFYYWANNTSASHRPANASPSTNIYSSSYFNGSIVQGNNLGAQERKIQLVWSTTRIYYYIDGILVLARNFTYNNAARAQIATNLAVGAFSTGFEANGFFPIDMSQFPMKFRVKRLRILAA